jgi:ADP-ribose pyrophosphatase YjhB (NUDIX family)
MPEFARQVPAGDSHERLVCRRCGFVLYENPKIIVGSVIVHQGRVLLCRRAIPPSVGRWTLPAGFLEMGETADEGARREAWEEACARIRLDGLLGIYNIRAIGQVQLIYRAGFEAEASFAAGPESSEVGIFGWDEIPWSNLAFSSVRWSLEVWRAAGSGPLGAPMRASDDHAMACEACGETKR